MKRNSIVLNRIFSLLVFSSIAINLCAQANDEKKPSTLVFHLFYNDFLTPNTIKTSSLSSVLKNGSWNNIGNMQIGFGLNYLKGINKNLDFAAALDASSTDYLYKDGSYNGSSKLLLEANIGANFKLLTDRHSLVPYLSGGVGMSVYQGNTGFYLPAGAGLQINLFDEGYIFSNIQYRVAISPTVNDHFYYSLGIGTSLHKKKKTQTPAAVAPIVAKVVAVGSEVKKTPIRDLRISVKDDQTGLPLRAVTVVMEGPDGKKTGVSDAKGEVVFPAVSADDYKVNGVLHEISTSSQSLSKSSFDIPDKEINISISHHDPRFTLSGSVHNKNTRLPEKGVSVSVLNVTQNTSSIGQNQEDGSFNVPLEVASDFTISGRKASYISNIEKVTTKGLNRSTTLYVNLELDIEEVVKDKTIALKNIYYDLGSAKIRSSASSDLEKLVVFLNDNPGLNIEIASHTDSRGSDASNLILSQARAQEVVNYLLQKGINKTRLFPKGYGETQLVNKCSNGVNCTEEEHAQNRRTEFKLNGTSLKDGK
jgi:outer membrane protein OmpA-like peptidoglycan-associated protein